MHAFITLRAVADLPVGHGTLMWGPKVYGDLRLTHTSPLGEFKLRLFWPDFGPGQAGWEETAFDPADHRIESKTRYLGAAGCWGLEQGGTASLFWVESSTPTHRLVHANRWVGVEPMPFTATPPVWSNLLELSSRTAPDEEEGGWEASLLRGLWGKNRIYAAISPAPIGGGADHVGLLIPTLVDYGGPLLKEWMGWEQTYCPLPVIR